MASRDPEYYGVAYLRPFFQREVASTPFDGEQRAIIAEYTLVCKNEKGGFGAVYDLS